MSLSTVLRRDVGLQLEVMTEPLADTLAETLVAFASDENAVMLETSLKAVYRWASSKKRRCSEVVL